MLHVHACLATETFHSISFLCNLHLILSVKHAQIASASLNECFTIDISSSCQTRMRDNRQTLRCHAEKLTLQGDYLFVEERIAWMSWQLFYLLLSSFILQEAFCYASLLLYLFFRELCMYYLCCFYRARSKTLWDIFGGDFFQKESWMLDEEWAVNTRSNQADTHSKTRWKKEKTEETNVNDIWNTVLFHFIIFTVMNDDRGYLFPFILSSIVMMTTCLSCFPPACVSLLSSLVLCLFLESHESTFYRQPKSLCWCITA